MNQEAIGKFIATCRKEANITQREFAEKLGVTDKTISRWENGHYLPDISLFEPLCDILNIDVIELLNARRMNEKTEEEVKDTVMNIVDISNTKIKSQKKKVILIGTVITLFLVAITIIITSYFLKSNVQGEREKPNTAVKFPTRIAVKEKADGWVCVFVVEDMVDDITKQQAPYSYSYDCMNFKYPSLPDYYSIGTEGKEDGDYEYQIKRPFPRYIFNKTFEEDLSNIDTYFTEKHFTTVIELEDLAALELSIIDKQEVLELYNKAIKSEPYFKYGQYPNIASENLYTSTVFDGYQWEIGYILAKGNIVYVDINLLIKDEYLVDLVSNNKANTQQEEFYKMIQNIEEEIIDKQLFEIDEQILSTSPFDFLQRLLNLIQFHEEKYPEYKLGIYHDQVGIDY